MGTSDGVGAQLPAKDRPAQPGWRPGGDLTPLEEEMVAGAAAGELVNRGGGPFRLAEMQTWGEERTVRAAILRDLLVARPWPVHAKGVRLRGVRISGLLDLEGAALRCPLSLKCCYLDAEEPARLDYATASRVTLTGCELAGLRGEMLTAKEVDLSGSTLTGPLSLSVADISGPLIMSGAQLNGADTIKGNALTAREIKVGGDVFLDEGFTAAGGVYLGGADITGRLKMSGAQINDANKERYALSADGIKVRLGVFLDEGFTAAGAIRLRVADIAGTLDMSGAQLNGADDDGNAMTANGIKVAGFVFLATSDDKGAFTAKGVIDLSDADITGLLNMGGAQLMWADKDGNALVASRIKVGGDMFFRSSSKRGTFTAAGALRLAGADITGQLDMRGAQLNGADMIKGNALVAARLKVGGDVFLDEGFTATGSGDGVAVDLTGARVGGTLKFDPARLKHATDSQRRLRVDGLTYAGVPELGSAQEGSAQEWVRLLREGTPRYAAQPYQQLAAGYRALGDERQARQILIAQRDHQLARTQPQPRRSERLWGRITKITLGYGYQPWRALLFLAGVVVLSCVLAVALGSHGALAQTDKTTTPGRSCTVIQQVSVGLDLNLPVGTSVARANCDLAKKSASAAAAWLTAGGWVLRLLAWAFAALFIAGFTSAVRKI